MGRVLALLLLLPTVASAEPRVLDRMVATVEAGRGRSGRLLITLSDLRIEARILLVSQGAVGAADGPIPDDTLAATLEWLIAQHLLHAEAEQLGVTQVESSILEASVESLRETLGEGFDSFLQRHELELSDLARILRRQLVVERYLRSRLRFAASVSEAEVREAYDAAPHGDWAEARPLLRAQLERRRQEQAVAALVSDLRSRAEVRILTRLDADEAEEPGVPSPWYLPRGGE